jgi:hypothetical protein
MRAWLRVLFSVFFSDCSSSGFSRVGGATGARRPSTTGKVGVAVKGMATLWPSLFNFQTLRGSARVRAGLICIKLSFVESWDAKREEVTGVYH